MVDRPHRAALACTIALVALGAALEATVAYRAATQSITYDEAGTYLKFLRGPFTDAFTHYDANNHVLFTALAHASISLFGVSEFSLRLPSVIGAASFFVAIALVCCRVFGGGAMSLLAVATVTLDPFVLDMMSAARGYGLAFSLLTTGLYCLTVALDGDRGRRLVWWGLASVALGLSVGAQLTFVWPAVALAVTAALVTMRRDFFTRSSTRELLCLVVPGALVASMILAVPLSNVRPGAMYYGAQRIAWSVRSLMEPVFDHQAGSWACAASRPDALVPTLAAIVCVAAVALIVGGQWVALRCGADGQVTRPILRRFTILANGSLLLTVVQLLVIRVFGFPYPEGRTGLYLMLMFPLAACSAVAALWESRSTRIVGRGGALLLALVSVWFLSEFTVTYFYEWRFDAGTRRIIDMLAEHARRSERPLRVWADDVGPSLSFYRTVDHLDAIATIPEAGTPPTPAYDFFVACSAAERERATRMGTTIYTDPVSDAVLVERR